MSRKGDCYDNAAMERFFHSLKGASKNPGFLAIPARNILIFH